MRKNYIFHNVDGGKEYNQWHIGNSNPALLLPRSSRKMTDPNVRRAKSATRQDKTVKKEAPRHMERRVRGLGQGISYYKSIVSKTYGKTPTVEEKALSG